MSQQRTFSMVRIEREDGVATLVLDRPEQLNVLSPATFQQMQWALDDVVADSSVEGIVIAGAGKAFSVGADISFMVRNVEAGTYDRILAVTYSTHALFNALADCPKPVIARVHGVAMGGGVELALACHHIVATPRASFCLPEAGLGIFPCLGGTQRTARAIGPGLAKWFLYTGATLPALNALKVGMASAVVDEAELDDVCRRYALRMMPSQPLPDRGADFAALESFFSLYRAEDIRVFRAETGGNPVLQRAMKSVAAKAPLALQWIEQLIGDGDPRPLEEGLQMEIDLMLDAYRTADAYRGLMHRVNNKIGVPAFEGR